MIDSFSKIVLFIAIGFGIGGVTKGAWLLVHNDWRGLPDLFVGVFILVLITTVLRIRSANR